MDIVTWWISATPPAHPNCGQSKKKAWSFNHSFLRYDPLLHHPEPHLVDDKAHDEDHHQLDQYHHVIIVINPVIITPQKIETIRWSEARVIKVWSWLSYSEQVLAYAFIKTHVHVPMYTWGTLPQNKTCSGDPHGARKKKCVQIRGLSEEKLPF